MTNDKTALLEIFTYLSGSMYVSDLDLLSKAQRERLADAIERRILPMDASLSEWNEALRYLFDAEPALDEAGARQLLIDKLRLR